MSEPDLGVKELYKRLQEKYNVQIEYDTVWHDKEKVMANICMALGRNISNNY
jgi:hypothetical protein